jgi:copper(I)-binding protein
VPRLPGAPDASIQEGRHPVITMPRIRPTGAALVAGALIGAVALAGCGAGQITQTSSQQSAVSGANGNVGKIGLRDVAIAFPEKAPTTATVYPKGGDAPLQMTIANAGAEPDRLVSAASPAGTVRISGPADIGGGQRIVVEGELPAAPTPTPAPSGAAAPGASASAAPTTGPSAAPGAAVIPSGSALPPVPTPAATGEPNPLAPQPSLGATPGPGGFNPAGPGQGTVQNPEAVNSGTRVVIGGLSDDIRSGLTYPVTFTFQKAGAITIAVPVALSSEEREDDE